MKQFKTLKHALATEKAIRSMEAQNIITFIVDNKATKKDVEQAFQKVFDTGVKKVRIVNDMKGRKKAYITVEGDALDVATKLGIM